MPSAGQLRILQRNYILFFFSNPSNHPNEIKTQNISAASSNKEGCKRKPSSLHHQKGPGEDVRPAPAQEIQPASGSRVHFYYLLYMQSSSRLIHHCLVWIDHQTGQGRSELQEKITSVNLPSAQDISCARKHHCRPLTTCSYFSPPVNAPKVCAPKRPRHIWDTWHIYRHCISLINVDFLYINIYTHLFVHLHNSSMFIFRFVRCFKLYVSSCKL